MRLFLFVLFLSHFSLIVNAQKFGIGAGLGWMIPTIEVDQFYITSAPTPQHYYISNLIGGNSPSITVFGQYEYKKNACGIDFTLGVEKLQIFYSEALVIIDQDTSLKVIEHGINSSNINIQAWYRYFLNYGNVRLFPEVGIGNNFSFVNENKTHGSFYSNPSLESASYIADGQLESSNDFLHRIYDHQQFYVSIGLGVRVKSFDSILRIHRFIKKERHQYRRLSFEFIFKRILTYSDLSDQEHIYFGE